MHATVPLQVPAGLREYEGAVLEAWGALIKGRMDALRVPADLPPGAPRTAPPPQTSATTSATVTAPPPCQQLEAATRPSQKVTRREVTGPRSCALVTHTRHTFHAVQLRLDLYVCAQWDLVIMHNAY